MRLRHTPPGRGSPQQQGEGGTDALCDVAPGLAYSQRRGQGRDSFLKNRQYLYWSESELVRDCNGDGACQQPDMASGVLKGCDTKLRSEAAWCSWCKGQHSFTITSRGGMFANRVYSCTGCKDAGVLLGGKQGSVRCSRTGCAAYGRRWVSYYLSFCELFILGCLFGTCGTGSWR